MQSPAVSMPLLLVSQEGKNLLGSLGISALSEDGNCAGAADGAEDRMDEDVVETHRKKTHYRGSESIRLNRK